MSVNKVRIEKVDNRVRFTFTDSSHYQYNGTADWPLNSLSMTIDSSDMVTFKNQAGDIVYSILLADLGKTKAEMEELYADVFVGSAGISPEDVQTAIDTALAPVNEDITDLSNEMAVKEEVTARALTDLQENKLDVSAYTPTDLSQYWTSAQTEAAITSATSGKADSSDVYTKAESDAAYAQAYNALTAHTSDSTIHVTASDKTNWNNKLDSTALQGYLLEADANVLYGNRIDELEQEQENYYEKSDIDNGTNAIAQALYELKEQKLDASGYTPVDLTNYYNKTETDAHIDAVAQRLGGLTLVKLTQSEYDALSVKDSNVLYIISNVVNS